MSTDFYVIITGPYDATGIGPFPTMRAATVYRATIDDRIFETFVLCEADFFDNMERFGLIPIETPTH